MQYTLAEIRDGTGFPPGAQFVMVDKQVHHPIYKPLNYYRQQIERVLGLSRDNFALKVEDREEGVTTTKWLRLNRDQLIRIAEILAEDES